MNNIKTIKIEQVKIGERVTSLDTKTVELIKKSINENGQYNPISLNLIDGEYVLISGYHRLIAHKELGLTEIEASVYTDLSKEKVEIIELEENIIRKHFDHFELGKLIEKYDKLCSNTSKTKKAKAKNEEIKDKTGVQPREIQRSRKLWNELSKNKSLIEHLETKTEPLVNEDLKKLASFSKENQEIIINLTKDLLNKKTLKNAILKVEHTIEEKIEQSRKQNLRKLTSNVCFKGDSLEILKSIPKNHFSHCITDIPYGISVKKEMGKNTTSCKSEEWDKDIPPLELFNEIYRTLKPGGFFVTTFSPRSDLILNLHDKLKEVGFNIKFNQLYWVHDPNLPRSYWMEDKQKSKVKEDEDNVDKSSNFKGEKTPHIASSVEPIIIVQKPFEDSIYEHATKALNDDTLSKGTINIEETKVNNKQVQQLISIEEINEFIGKRFSIKNWSQQIFGNMIFTSKPNEEKNYNYKGEEIKSKNVNSKKANDHASVKPVALFAYLLKLFNTDKDGIILEPFAGSGTTLISSKLLKMNYFGIEQDDGYYEIIKQRLIQDKSYTNDDLKSNFFNN
ncbi:type II DNA methyltransferase (ParB-like nuclease domain) [Malaciobacter marinus]|uniref:Type II DNA methyltransferase (ParB-like nuclease domain) n=1 Tax=Malaciobacter marinus TaxID=505249 RepID=A0A347TIS1_9BACT|nr:DNA methyltransferase [Malaciobacter marinus]AXX86499.1 type II DNA methyltransferase (ParB-like nuclease domain) [Malaciobacter marinus]PHO14065.1 hypothetical protein CPH92_13875 [Malaciobacter marinus]